MSRTGMPMYRASQHCLVFITVKWSNGTRECRTITGGWERSIKQVMTSAKTRYAKLNAKCTYNGGWYVTN